MRKYRIEQRDGIPRDLVNQLNHNFEMVFKDIMAGRNVTVPKPSIVPVLTEPVGAVNTNATTPANPGQVNTKPGVSDPPPPPDISVITDGVTITGDGDAVPIALVEPFLFAVRSVSVSPDAVQASDQIILASAGAGADIIENLPASVGPDANGRSRVLIFKKMDVNPHNVVITAAGADTIDGAATSTITIQFDMLRLVDGAAGVWSIW